jgi:hypothetical protein
MRQGWQIGGTSDDMVSKAQALIEQVAALRSVLGDAFANAYTVGTFTMPAANSSVISAPSVTANSVVFLSPINASAAALMAGASSLYHDRPSNIVGTSFTVDTADGNNAAGTEQFAYLLINP